MRILFDECVNPRLRLAFPGDEVKTVAEMGWRALANGALMKKAASRFDVFVTLDQNLPFENQTGKYALELLSLSPSSITLQHTGHSLQESGTWLCKRNLDKSTF